MLVSFYLEHGDPDMPATHLTDLNLTAVPSRDDLVSFGDTGTYAVWKVTWRFDLGTGLRYAMVTVLQPPVWHDRYVMRGWRGWQVRE